MAEGRKKRSRPKAEAPKGFRDQFGRDVILRDEMLRGVAEVYHRYGFEPLESPAVENLDALGKFLPDIDRPNAGVFAWREGDLPGASGDSSSASANGGRDWLALRYDLTAPLARVYAQHRNDLPTPYRRYAMGPVWRNEKPGPGRFRQFYQCDADTVGSPSMAADAEMLAMLADALEVSGIDRGDYVLRVNDRNVLDGALEIAGIGKGESDGGGEASDSELRRGTVMRAIDKLDRLGIEGVRALLGEGRKDESGDYTVGAGLSGDQVAVVLEVLEARRDSSAGTLGRLGELVGNSEAGRRGVENLERIAEFLEAGGYGADRVVVDPSVVRGLGYYTGPVYEAELTFEIRDEKGRLRQFGSVAGGGRYDGLVRRFTGQDVPATGVSLGVDRLLAALRERGRAAGGGAGPVVVTVMEPDRMADCLEMAAELRRAGIRAETYLGNPKNFGNQLKYADRRGSPAAVIRGESERLAGTVQIKDLALGAELAKGATLEQWRDRPSQFEAPREELVPRLREILDRAGASGGSGGQDSGSA